MLSTNSNEPKRSSTTRSAFDGRTMSAPVDFEYELTGPKRGADRAVLVAHGAGADMHAVTLTALSEALAASGIPAMRFNFAYKAAGRGAPPKAPVLEIELRRARDELAKRTKLPVERIVVGGRSMGGRIASMVAAVDGALGVALLAYPLHPPGRPEAVRVAHFSGLAMPILFVSGTRDTFGSPEELQAQAEAIPGAVTWHWIETADHGFRPLKKLTGLTTEQVLVPAAATLAAWVASLGGTQPLR